MLDHNKIKEHLINFGLMPDDIIFDGEIHRVPTVKNPKKINGWYVVLDTAIVFGDWSTNMQETLSLKTGDTLSNKVNIRNLLSKPQTEHLKKQREAQKEAHSVYMASDEPPLNHGYIKRKHIEPLGFGYNKTTRQLLVPIIDIETRKIWNLQRISENGDKRFLKNGAINGMCYAAINDGVYARDRGHVLICEGVATALSIHQYNKSVVLAALNAGNLANVAIKARYMWPNLNIVICADNDHLTELKTGKNVGLEKATDAAKLVNASLSLPPFSKKQLDEGLTDWNDYLIALEAAA